MHKCVAYTNAARSNRSRGTQVPSAAAMGSVAVGAIPIGHNRPLESNSELTGVVEGSFMNIAWSRDKEDVLTHPQVEAPSPEWNDSAAGKAA